MLGLQKKFVSRSHKMKPIELEELMLSRNSVPSFMVLNSTLLHLPPLRFHWFWRTLRSNLELLQRLHWWSVRLVHSICQLVFYCTKVLAATGGPGAMKPNTCQYCHWLTVSWSPSCGSRAGCCWTPGPLTTPAPSPPGSHPF
jgi:hypothetical protein